MPIDFGRHSEDYGRFRPGFPPSFYRRVAAIVGGFRGKEVVDLGCGPGVMALALASRGASVVGVDRARAQIEVGRQLARERKLDDVVQLRVASADATGLPDGCADLVTAGQCWWWFDSAATLSEVERLLRPGGWLVVAAYCYLSHRSEEARAAEALVLELNPSWDLAGSTGIYPKWIDGLRTAHLHLEEQLCYDTDEIFTHEALRARMRTCNGVGSGGMSPEQVREFDRRLATLLRDRFPEPLAIPHRVWCVVYRRS